MARSIRDMSKAQFDRECERRGFERDWFGYYSVANGRALINPLNSGSRNRRAWLAYLIRKDEQYRR